jgi:Protein of unknown function (DUF3159)
VSQTAPRRNVGASDDVPSPPVQTVESLVKAQLSRALGGKRGMLEGAVPTLGFTVTWVFTHDLRLALGVSGLLAATAFLIRLVQRSTVQFVLNAMVGIAVAAVFALRSGRAEDAFLPGLLYNAAYTVVLSGSALLRWPLVGFMIGGVTGDLTGWHADDRLRALCSKLTWLLAVPCLLRVLVQYPLWSSGQAGWLGVAKLAMGWPLQLAALAAMVWVLNRDDTPVPATASS